MKKIAAILMLVIILTFGKTLLAASLYNSDAKEYSVKIRSKGDPWVFLTLYEVSYKYFDCTYGCEIIIIDTESKIELESDADVIIDKGTLKRRYR